MTEFLDHLLQTGEVKPEPKRRGRAVEAHRPTQAQQRKVQMFANQQGVTVESAIDQRGQVMVYTSSGPFPDHIHVLDRAGAIVVSATLQPHEDLWVWGDTVYVKGEGTYEQMEEAMRAFVTVPLTSLAPVSPNQPAPPRFTVEESLLDD